MKKSGFIIGSIEIILGLLSLLVTSVIREIIPKLASIYSMFNTRDFFEGNYIVSFGFANIISICLCLIGLLTIVYFAFNKKDTECVLTSRPPQFRCSYYWQVTNVQSVFLVFSMLLPSLLREQGVMNVARVQISPSPPKSSRAFNSGTFFVYIDEACFVNNLLPW